ncbi:hypothetical protein POM88_051379 [Heracleum sosnowskyi]|uniref:Uncharacterized protein n=1 Tax=Heracleum sosnowskyi TaxID=360622 RepID=A0AAD8H1S4_9APIA|nr:hypothetical protein POM88_051379 [Heracleum sosnowskyi]
MTYYFKIKVEVRLQVYTQKMVRSDKFKTGKEQYVEKAVCREIEEEIPIGTLPVMYYSLKPLQTFVAQEQICLIAQEQICLKRLWIILVVEKLIDSDDFRNKRVELAGQLLERELNVHLKHAEKRMVKAMQKDVYKDKVENSERYLDSSIIRNGLLRAFSTGTWSHSYIRGKGPPV